MNFEDAVESHKSGNDMYRKTRSHLFWAEGDSILRFTMIAFPDEYVYFNLTDTTATDWAAVEEKVKTLSDKIADWNGCDVYYETDIQQFITEIIKKCTEDGIDVWEVNGYIKKCAGDRFK